MSKSVLGRGLGSLMNGGKPAVSVNPPDTATAGSEPVAGPGVSSLLQGKVRPAVVPPPNAQPQPIVKARAVPFIIPRWYFFAADVLLVSLAGFVALRSPGGMTWKEVAFCIVAVALGAVLAAVGILQTDHAE